MPPVQRSKVASPGASYEEALANIREAIDLYVQDLLEAGQAIPLDQGTIELAEPAVLVNV
jgi:predicted RNase H-like HicB family nuclease